MERDRKIGDRMKVVMLADQGEIFAEIAQFLFIDERNILKSLINRHTGLLLLV